MNQVKLAIDAVLSHYPTVQAIYLFGSFATENERPDSDADVALLFAPDEAKTFGSLIRSRLHSELEHLFCRDVDLINVRSVSTVLQKEIIAADRRVYVGDEKAAAEFEMLTLSLYQKLNEERSEIIESAIAGGRLHQV